VFNFHVNQITGRKIQSWSWYHDQETFKQTAKGRKIACFQIPYPYTSDIEEEINSIYDSADYILIIGSELHTKTVDFIKKFDLPKISYFICGYLNGRMNNAKIYKFLDWFTTTVHFYKNIKPSILFNIDAHGTKPLMFDALLGRKKPHRDQVYFALQEQGLMDKGIVTYLNSHTATLGKEDSEMWIWQKDGIIDLESHLNNISFTVDRLDYYGYNMSISQIVPIDVYNKTAYSLVTETNMDNHFVFYTEKTVKPILARRLFIAVGNQFHLAGLRRLGFKTFDGIIDESYDTLESYVDRSRAAVAQLQSLCEKDQSVILKQILPIVEHNYNHMMTFDWYKLFSNDFGDCFFPPNSRTI
jgi:hypothetical protein